MIRVPRYTVAACLLIALALSGCAAWAGTQRALVGLNYPHATGETLGRLPDEHYHTVRSSAPHDARALVEDLDLLFLTDRPTRLTRWHDR